MHSKAPFKPVWDKDRDRDDNWDTASISSDCSESDANLEWWYTKPPRPSLHPSAGTAATTVSASIVQPETTVRVDPETRMLVLADSSQVERTPSSETHGHGYHVRPILSSMANSIVGVATGSLISPSAVYKSPPHSASSPLAREIKFEQEASSTPPPPQFPVTAASSCSSSPIQYKSKADSCHSSTSLEEERAALRSRRGPAPGGHRFHEVPDEKGEQESIGGGYLNEDGHLIGGGDTDDGRDSGIESLDSREHEKDRGWVDSVSRWLWSADGKKVPDLSVGGGLRCDRCDE